MKLNTLVVCLTFVFGSSLDSLAQFVPVTAKLKSVSYQRQSDGSEIVVHQTEGSYFRNSSGSVMETQFHIEDGRILRQGTSHYKDASTGKIYTLEHDVNKAKVDQKVPVPFFPPSAGPPITVGEAVVGGLQCVATPIVLNGDVGNPIGKAWWSVDNTLLVKREYAIGDIRTVWELYEISFTEPVPSKFMVPEHCTVDSSDCVGCDQNASP